MEDLVNWRQVPFPDLVERTQNRAFGMGELLNVIRSRVEIISLASSLNDKHSHPLYQELDGSPTATLFENLGTYHKHLAMQQTKSRGGLAKTELALKSLIKKGDVMLARHDREVRNTHKKVNKNKEVLRRVRADLRAAESAFNKARDKLFELRRESYAETERGSAGSVNEAVGDADQRSSSTTSSSSMSATWVGMSSMFSQTTQQKVHKQASIVTKRYQELHNVWRTWGSAREDMLRSLYTRDVAIDEATRNLYNLDKERAHLTKIAMRNLVVIEREELTRRLAALESVSTAVNNLDYSVENGVFVKDRMDPHNCHSFGRALQLLEWYDASTRHRITQEKRRDEEASAADGGSNKRQSSQIELNKEVKARERTASESNQDSIDDGLWMESSTGTGGNPSNRRRSRGESLVLELDEMATLRKTKASTNRKSDSTLKNRTLEEEEPLKQVKQADQGETAKAGDDDLDPSVEGLQMVVFSAMSKIFPKDERYTKSSRTLCTINGTAKSLEVHFTTPPDSPTEAWGSTESEGAGKGIDSDRDGRGDSDELAHGLKGDSGDAPGASVDGAGDGAGDESDKADTKPNDTDKQNEARAPSAGRRGSAVVHLTWQSIFAEPKRYARQIYLRELDIARGRCSELSRESWEQLAGSLVACLDSCIHGSPLDLSHALRCANMCKTYFRMEDGQDRQTMDNTESPAKNGRLYLQAHPLLWGHRMWRKTYPHSRHQQEWLSLAPRSPLTAMLDQGLITPLQSTDAPERSAGVVASHENSKDEPSTTFENDLEFFATNLAVGDFDKLSRYFGSTESTYQRHVEWVRTFPEEGASDFWELGLRQCLAKQMKSAFTTPPEWADLYLDDDEGIVETIRSVHNLVFGQIGALGFAMEGLGMSKNEVQKQLRSMAAAEQLSEDLVLQLIEEKAG